MKTNTLPKNTLPKSQAEHRARLYKSDAAITAATSVRRRSDNVQLADRVRGKVATGAAKRAVRVTDEPEKTGMYEKPACGLLDTQRYLVVRNRRKARPAAGSVLRVPKDAGPEERGNMRRWLATAEAISRHLSR